MTCCQNCAWLGLGATYLGVPIVRTIVFGVYIGVPLFRETTTCGPANEDNSYAQQDLQVMLSAVIRTKHQATKP